MSTSAPVRVFVVEDHHPYREALAATLSRSGVFDLVGSSGSGEQVESLAAAGLVDLVVCDVHLGSASGIDLCRRLRTLGPDTQVCMLSADSRSEVVLEAIAAGATGFIYKNTRPAELLELLALAARGEDAFDRICAAQLAATARRRAGEATFELSVSQRAVLNGLADGLAGAVLAERVGLDDAACSREIAALLEELGATNETALVARALRSGLIA